MTGKTKRRLLHPAIYLLVIIAISLWGCAHKGQSIVSRQREKTAAIPSHWRSAVILLENRTELAFEVRQDGNRVKRKDIVWAYVNKRNPNDWERISIYDYETIEKPVKIKAKAYYPDGSSWTLDNETLQRSKIVLSNAFSNEFNIPRYDKGVLIRLETQRVYEHPEFIGTFQLRDEDPTLLRAITFTYPHECDLLYGLENTEGVEVEQSILVENGKKKIEIRAENLTDSWDSWKTEFPERWYAAFYISFPPKGKRSYTWKELGDHYLQLSKTAYESSPKIDALAGLVKGSTAPEIIKNSFDTIVYKIRYHADEEGRFALFPRKASTILENGYGDCKEISTLLKTILQEKNVDTFPALIATKNHFQPVEQYPSLDNFNHMILATATPKGGYHFLDGTNTWAKAQSSYYPLIGRTAFVSRPGGSHLIQVAAGNHFQSRVVTHARVSKASKETPWTIKGSIRLIGYPALQFFSKLNWSDSIEKNSLAKLFLQKQFGIYPFSVQFSAPDSTEITLNYEALFQENYLSMGKGGFRLAVPRLYSIAADDTLDQNKGPRQIKPFEQQDIWEFGQTPTSSRFNDFHLPFADCDYAVKKNKITRRYQQKEKIFQDNDLHLETWIKHIKTTVGSTCWR